MSSAIDMRALINKKRQELAAKSSNFSPITLPPGRSEIRLLPTWRKSPDGTPQAWWHDFGQHWVKTVANGKAEAVMVCPEVTYGRECPICAAIAKGVVRAKDRGDSALEALIKESNASPKYLVNALILSGAAAKPEEVRTPKVVGLGSTVFSQILDIYQEFASEDVGVDITSIEAGVTLVVNRTGSGRDTKYTVQAHPKGVTKLDKAEGLLDRLNNIDELVAIEAARGGEVKCLGRINHVLGKPAESSEYAAPSLTAGLADDAIDAEFEEATTSSKSAKSAAPALSVDAEDDVEVNLDDVDLDDIVDGLED